MSDAWQGGALGAGARPPSAAQGSSANLADILERVLDKGVVIAGDIQINLLDIELLTIKLRLLVASVDKAKEMGIDWWEHDPSLSSRASREPRAATARPEPAEPAARDTLAQENALLRRELEELRAAAGLPAAQSAPAASGRDERDGRDDGEPAEDGQDADGRAHGPVPAPRRRSGESRRSADARQDRAREEGR